MGPNPEAKKLKELTQFGVYNYAPADSQIGTASAQEDMGNLSLDGKPKIKPLGCCNVCRATTSKRCGGCGLVVYCGREHQLEDRKNHKETCAKVRRVVVTETGAIVQAKGDIKMLKGLYPKQVMTLNPMLLIPVLPKPDELAAFAVSCPTPPEVRLTPCLGCYQLSGFSHIIIDPDRGICMGHCSKCGWPMHNQMCEKSEAHQMECAFFQKFNINPNKNFENLPNDFMCIGILRALLLKRDNRPEWASLVSMPVAEQRKDPRYTIPEYLSMTETAVAKIKQFIYEKCRISNKFISEADLEHLIRVVRSNQLPSQCLNHYNKPFASMIFYGFQGRGLTHDCRPNCSIQQDVKSMQCTVWTLREIKAGETLTINYDAGGIQGLRGLSMLSRAIFLQNELGCPPCQCSMCRDPTEDGTYFSAIRCTTKKCPGFILPTEPTNWSQAATWECDKANCNQTMTMVEVEQRVLLFLRNFRAQGVVGNESALMKVTKAFAADVLHPNQYHILTGYIKASEVLIMRMQNKEQYLSAGRIIPARFVFHKHENPKYLEVFQRVMEFYDLAQPGYNYFYIFSEDVVLCISDSNQRHGGPLPSSSV